MQASETKLSVKMTFAASATSTSSGISKAGLSDEDLNKLYMLLRSLAKDDDDYERLKSIFKNALSQAQKLFNNMTPAMSGLSAGQGAGQATGQAAGEAMVQSTQSASIELSMEITHVEGRVEINSVQMAQADPLVLDMGDEGISLSAAGSGAYFDINADGRKDSTAWVQGSSAFLALDRNNNGQIDDGSELFGDQNGAAHGFEELAHYDSNGDNVIDRRDPVFQALKIYRSTQAASEGGQVQSMEQSGHLLHQPQLQPDKRKYRRKQSYIERLLYHNGRKDS